MNNLVEAAAAAGQARTPQDELRARVRALEAQHLSPKTITNYENILKKYVYIRF